MEEPWVKRAVNAFKALYWVTLASKAPPLMSL